MDVVLVPSDYIRIHCGSHEDDVGYTCSLNRQKALVSRTPNGMQPLKQNVAWYRSKRIGTNARFSAETKGVRARETPAAYEAQASMALRKSFHFCLKLSCSEFIWAFHVSKMGSSFKVIAHPPQQIASWSPPRLSPYLPSALQDFYFHFELLHFSS